MLLKRLCYSLAICAFLSAPAANADMLTDWLTGQGFSSSGAFDSWSFVDPALSFASQATTGAPTGSGSMAPQGPSARVNNQPAGGTPFQGGFQGSQVNGINGPAVWNNQNAPGFNGQSGQFPGASGGGNVGTKRNGLPPTSMDSFVYEAKEHKEDIYGDEGVWDIPPFFQFLPANRINTGILDRRDRGLTTGHGAMMPDAWGADEFLSPPGEWSQSGSDGARQSQGYYNGSPIVGGSGGPGSPIAGGSANAPNRGGAP